MKFGTLLCMIAWCNVSIAQIDIQDRSEEPKVRAIPYNGEFISLKGVYEEGKKAGLVGELVTLIEVSTYNIYTNKKDLDYRQNISYELQELFNNKTYRIIGYEDDYGDILTIEGDKGTFLWKVSYSDTYVLNKYIDRLKEIYEGKVFVPLHMESEYKSASRVMKVDGNEKYEVNKVSFAKFQSDYGIIFNLNDSLEFIFSTEKYDHPKVFNGSKYEYNDDYVTLRTNETFRKEIVFIEENEFNVFKKANANYLTDIRNRKVRIGMHKNQCVWAWGIPNNIIKDVAGYDKVLTYFSNNLFFKEEILKAIKENR